LRLIAGKGIVVRRSPDPLSVRSARFIAISSSTATVVPSAASLAGTTRGKGSDTMTMRRNLASIGIGVLLIAGAVAMWPLPGAGAQGSAADEDRAAEIALAEYPYATVLSIESEQEGGLFLYEVELSNGAEVEIDSASWEIVDREQDNSATDDDDPTGDQFDD
jgi:hypothetical protein